MNQSKIEAIIIVLKRSLDNDVSHNTAQEIVKMTLLALEEEKGKLI